MADISKELKAFKEAVYGEDVRDGLVSSITKINEEAEDSTQKVAKYEAAESSRVSAEAARAAAETERVSAETARKTAETSRISAERTRASQESSRVSAETSRAYAETSRATAETGRAAAESSRVSAETARATAETAREAAEEGRQETAEACEIATGKANTAADRADEAAAKAEGLVIGDISTYEVTFQQALDRANIQSGDTLSVAFGKLAKFCADLKLHAFADPVNNLVGTDPSLPLAAPQGKALDNRITELNSALNKKQDSLSKPTLTGDMDNAKTPGWYWAQFANITNGPYTTGYGWAHIMGTETALVQIVYRYNVSGITQVNMRGFTNSKWYPWRVVATEEFTVTS